MNYQTIQYAVTDGVAAPVATSASLDITPLNDAPVTTPVTLTAIAEDSGARLIARKSVVEGTSEEPGVALGGRRMANK